MSAVTIFVFKVPCNHECAMNCQLKHIKGFWKMQSLRSYLLAYIKVVQKLKFIIGWVLPSNWKYDDFSMYIINSREDLHNENSAFP